MSIICWKPLSIQKWNKTGSTSSWLVVLEFDILPSNCVDGTFSDVHAHKMKTKLQFNLGQMWCRLRYQSHSIFIMLCIIWRKPQNTKKPNKHHWTYLWVMDMFIKLFQWCRDLSNNKFSGPLDFSGMSNTSPILSNMWDIPYSSLKLIFLTFI